MIKLDLLQGHKDGLTYTINVIHHTNKMKENPHDHLSSEKYISKIQYPFIIKILIKVGIEETYLNMIKVINDKIRANIIFNGEKLKAFLLNSGRRQWCPFLSLFFFFCFFGHCYLI